MKQIIFLLFLFVKYVLYIFFKVMHKNNLKYAGELASLSIPQIILVYDAQRNIELFSCVSSGKHRKVQKSEMHDLLFHYNTLLPFAVSRNFILRISAAPRHIIILPRKISKYSNIVQIFSSICRFNAMVIFSLFTFNFASVTA